MQDFCILIAIIPTNNLNKLHPLKEQSARLLLSLNTAFDYYFEAAPQLFFNV